MPTLGFIEVPFLSIAAMLAQTVATTAAVRILGFEATGNENILVRLGGEVSQIRAALDTAVAVAPDLGVEIVAGIIPRPDPGFSTMVDFPNVHNTLYGGRDQFLPGDYPAKPNKIMTTHPQAVGILETQGLTAILEATDAMLKAANVKVVGKEKIGAAYVTVVIAGDIAAVTAAVEAGKHAVGSLGKVIAGHVIARPHNDLLALLPK